MCNTTQKKKKEEFVCIIKFVEFVVSNVKLQSFSELIPKKVIPLQFGFKCQAHNLFLLFREYFKFKSL